MRRWPYILVVDDDRDFREGLRAALEMKGYQVEEAGNGKEAFDEIEAKPPLLVLLDLQMPVMNGRELLQKLRSLAETKDIPVVIISGFGFEWEAELMGAVNVDVGHGIGSIFVTRFSIRGRRGVRHMAARPGG